MDPYKYWNGPKLKKIALTAYIHQLTKLLKLENIICIKVTCNGIHIWVGHQPGVSKIR